MSAKKANSKSNVQKNEKEWKQQRKTEEKTWNSHKLSSVYKYESMRNAYFAR